MSDDPKKNAKPAEKNKVEQALDNAADWVAKQQYKAMLWEEKNIPGVKALAEFEAKHVSWLLPESVEKAIHDYSVSSAEHVDHTSVKTPSVKNAKPATTETHVVK